MFIHICLHLDDVIIPGESTNRSDSWLKFFFRFYAIIRVFRRFDGLSSVPGSKSSAKKRKLIREIQGNY